MRNPPRWQRPWATLYPQALEMLEEADASGISSVWLSEHHFFEDGYLSQPLTFGAAVAARTKHMRIGTSVTLPALRHPIHLAEEAALVDLISGGRLELGLGAGYRETEYKEFGLELKDRYALTDRATRLIRQLWSTGRVMPPPVQDPVPIWLGYQGPMGARRAGRAGEGLLSLNPKLLQPYQEGLAEGGHDAAAARMTGHVSVIVANDPEAVWAKIRPHVAYQLDTYRAYAVEGTGVPAPPPVDPDRWRKSAPPRSGLYPIDVVTPTAAVQAIRSACAGLPVNAVHLWASIAGMPDEIVAEHVDLIASRVIPALSETSGRRDDTTRGWAVTGRVVDGR
jgi:alkanesulfonate monooxygenase SsuD/methylene tetrahydromethanopterin reductase-like flavin-dependent oxidoreductase (luciferase family)